MVTIRLVTKKISRVLILILRNRLFFVNNCIFFYSASKQCKHIHGVLQKSRRAFSVKPKVTKIANVIKIFFFFPIHPNHRQSRNLNTLNCNSRFPKYIVSNISTITIINRNDKCQLLFVSNRVKEINIFQIRIDS